MSGLNYLAIGPDIGIAINAIYDIGDIMSRYRSTPDIGTNFRPSLAISCQYRDTSDNPFPKPDENYALSAKRNVHI